MGFKYDNKKCMYHSPSIENDLFVHRLTNLLGLNEERTLELYQTIYYCWLWFQMSRGNEPLSRWKLVLCFSGAFQIIKTSPQIMTILQVLSNGFQHFVVFIGSIASHLWDKVYWQLRWLWNEYLHTRCFFGLLINPCSDCSPGWMHASFNTVTLKRAVAVLDTDFSIWRLFTKFPRKMCCFCKLRSYQYI